MKERAKRLFAREADSPLPVLVVVAILVVAIDTVIDASNDVFFAIAMAGVAFIVIWTLPQAFKPREPRRRGAHNSKR